MSNPFKYFASEMLTQAHQSVKRASGTIPESIKHSMIHTQSPNATIHHTITAACPHPVKERADKGEYYMVAYVSIPPRWLEFMDQEFAKTWNIQFVGPAGTIQRLPPVLIEMEDLLGDRIYVGFDWCWLGGEPRLQPSAEHIKGNLVKFAETIRGRVK